MMIGLGIFLGFIGGYLWTTNRLQNALTEARIKEQSQEQLLKVQGQLLEKLDKEFKQVADSTLKEQSSDLRLIQQQEMKSALDPFKDTISDLKKRLDQIHTTETEQRSALATTIKLMNDAQVKISEDTQLLTEALKGKSAVRGAWGEKVLESILVACGMQPKLHFEVQAEASSDGSRMRPDILLYLPDDHQLVLDSKVTLMSYLELLKYQDEKVKDSHRIAQLESDICDGVKTHVQQLSNKDYSRLYPGKNISAVIMFIPIEDVYFMAYRNGILEEAYKKNVIIVCPGNIVGLIRIIMDFHKSQSQIKNISHILSLAQSALKKFEGFTEDFNEIQQRLMKASEAWEGARTKLMGRAGLDSQLKKMDQLMEGQSTLPNTEEEF
ncbi:MAG: DNA recombination protein RmuC [Holophagaceae bacterium]